MPVISATTRLVAGSMRWMLSPAAFVWTMRTEPAAPRASGARTTASARDLSILIIISVGLRHETPAAPAHPLARAASTDAGGFARRPVARFRLLQVARRADLLEQTE